VCRAAGTALAAWHTLLGVVKPVSDQSRTAVATILPALVPDAFPGPSPDAFPGYGEGAPLDLPPLTAKLEGQLRGPAGLP
jgi:hypothetical protein